jgi:hypothetical protein
MTALLPRRLAVLTAALGLTLAGTLGATGTAHAASTPANVGLYGTTDPTYDGVFRQSLALLGLHAAGQTPDRTAVTWLLDQQCSGGGFSSYNPKPAKGCPAYDAKTFSGGIDTNATSLALQALIATGHSAQAVKAAKALRAAQDSDGGWPFTVGGGFSDPNSTGLVLSALAAAGDGVDARGATYIASFQVGCGTTEAPTDAADQGGLASPYSNGAPDVLATVQAVPGLAGLNLAKTIPTAGSWADGGPVFPCDNASPSPSPSLSPSASPSPASTADVAAWASTWLAGQAGAGNVTTSDLGWAILSFASTHSHHDAAAALYGNLVASLPVSKAAAIKARGSVKAVAQSAESPGALGLAALSAQSLGHHGAAGTFATRIGATITAAAAKPSASASASATPSASHSRSSSPAASASATGSGDPGLPRTGGEPYVLAGGLAFLLLGTGLISVGARRVAARSAMTPG